MATAHELTRVFEEDRERIRALGRIAGSALRVHHELERHPLQTVATASRRTGLSVPTVTAAMKALEGERIVREITGKQRGRVFGYDRYLTLLNEGAPS